MKRSLKIIFLLIVAVILVSIAAIIGIAIRDYKNKVDAKEALRYCYVAEANGYKEMLIEYLENAEHKLRETRYNSLFFKKWCATECCRIVVNLTTSEMVLKMSIKDKLAIFDLLHKIATYAYELEHSDFNEYVKLISDYNMATIERDVNKFNSVLLPTAEKLLSKNPKEPVICDIICKMFIIQCDYKSTIKYASQYPDIAKCPKTFSMEIIRMYHSSYLRLGNYELADKIADLSDSLFNKKPDALPYNAIQTFF